MALLVATCKLMAFDHMITLKFGKQSRFQFVKLKIYVFFLDEIQGQILESLPIILKKGK